MYSQIDLVIWPLIIRHLCKLNIEILQRFQSKILLIINVSWYITNEKIYQGLNMDGFFIFYGTWSSNWKIRKEIKARTVKYKERIHQYSTYHKI